MSWKSEKITLCKLLLLILYMCVTITQSSFNVNYISLILDLQRSNEMHKNIKCPGGRIKCLPINTNFTKQCIFSLIMMTWIAWFICLFIILCGTLLFLIYINDIVKKIGCSIRLFADDTSLYIIVDSPDGAAYHLNVDLNSISKWADAWLVALNTGKTLSMIFSRKLHRPHHPPLLMDNTMLTETDTHNHLGRFDR